MTYFNFNKDNRWFCFRFGAIALWAFSLVACGFVPASQNIANDTLVSAGEPQMEVVAPSGPPEQMENPLQVRRVIDGDTIEIPCQYGITKRHTNTKVNEPPAE